MGGGMIGEGGLCEPEGSGDFRQLARQKSLRSYHQTSLYGACVSLAMDNQGSEGSLGNQKCRMKESSNDYRIRLSGLVLSHE